STAELRALLAAPVATLEPVDAPAGVHELLLARVEGMALGAELDVQVALGRSRGEGVAAGAAHLGHDVVRMDVGLHRVSQSKGQALEITRRRALWRSRPEIRRST